MSHFPNPYFLKTITERFASQEGCSNLVNRLALSGYSSTLAKGLVGSSRSLLAAYYLEKVGGINVFILNDKEEAAYFYDDLYNLTESDNVLFFPSSYKRSIQYEQIDSSGIIQRTAVLSMLEKENGGKLTAIVSYPDALAEKVVSKETVGKNTLKIKKGEQLSISFVKEVMAEYGFERADFVYEPGQYSVRGSIVDIFSFSTNKPYRIDFFGNEVDSIRTFDLSTQLSIDQLDSIDIVSDLHKSEASHTFFDLLGKNVKLWFNNYDIFQQSVENTIKSVEDKECRSTLVKDAAFLGLSKRFSNVLFSQPTFDEITETIEFSTSPQPSFNKNFDLLAANIREGKEKGYTTIILADNLKQHERLSQIFSSIAPNEALFEPQKTSLHEGFIDNNIKICFYTDHQIFQRYQRFKLRKNLDKSEALTIQELNSLQPGDYVVHIDHGVGVFGGLVKTEVNGTSQEVIKLIYRDNDVLFVNIQGLHRISRFKSKEGAPPKIYKLGTGAWQKLKQATKKKVKDIAQELIALYAKRKATEGFAFAPDSFLQHELEASFIYEDTPDQEKSTKAVKEDMESPNPMDRLVCGDVGFGKTEIAIRAAFKAATDNKQVAVLVPTTILALQHHKTFCERLKEFPIKIDFISRLKSTKEIKKTLKEVEEGTINIIIGTHRLLSKDVKFKDLGLLIVDEEQKFGVGAKEKLRQLKLNVDTLTLTATPIPRTLQFSLLGARDLSIINTPPPNRQPIHTEVHTFNEDIIKEAVSYEVGRGGQVFFIHNRIHDIKEVQDIIRRLCPDVRTAIGHGQMTADELEEVILDFMNGDTDVLISTSIVESGLDVPNANTIIINAAQNFGLSDLHQLRGRVGRSNKRAYCYLLAPPPLVLSDDARRRLRAIEEFSDLGSGFNIAMQDLDIRGAGNLLGGEQSGFISDIGFETYQRILNEALQELQEENMVNQLASKDGNAQAELAIEEKSSSFVTDCYIEADFEALFPDDYVHNTTEKIRLYKELDGMSSEDELQKFRNKLVDRFGNPPAEAEELFNIVRIRQRATRLGFEKIVMKNKLMISYFIANQLSPYYRTKLFATVLQYIQSRPSLFKVKETNGKLSLTTINVTSAAQAIGIFDSIIDAVNRKAN